MSRAAVVMLALWCAGAAAAQSQVYRCGADGRGYSHQPCEAGRTVDVADPRSAEQAAQTRQATQRDARLAEELERSRLQAERHAARQGPALIGWSRAPAADEKASCAKGAACKRGEPSKRPAGKVRSVVLYRGAESPTR
jgi:hypothetical protein